MTYLIPSAMTAEITNDYNINKFKNYLINTNLFLVSTAHTQTQK